MCISIPKCPSLQIDTLHLMDYFNGPLTNVEYRHITYILEQTSIIVIKVGLRETVSLWFGLPKTSTGIRFGRKQHRVLTCTTRGIVYTYTTGVVLGLKDPDPGLSSSLTFDVLCVLRRETSESLTVFNKSSVTRESFINNLLTYSLFPYLFYLLICPLLF